MGNELISALYIMEAACSSEREVQKPNGVLTVMHTIIVRKSGVLSVLNTFFIRRLQMCKEAWRKIKNFYFYLVDI